jgi:SusD family.
MKKLFLYAALLFGMSGFTACNYLDIVPDEREQEKDAYTNEIAALRMLYSCYGYMPNPADNTSSLDFFTGDEVVTSFMNIDGFASGNWTANTTLSNNYYRNLYAGIRQCWIFLEHMNEYVGIDDVKENYIAQCHFLIAYYHMRLMMGWGPIIIVDKVEDLTGNLDTEYKSRSTLSECVEFICTQYDLAINSGALKERYDDNQTGLATSVLAKSMKAYTLMYYASPLFNGNATLAAQLVNRDGTALLSADPDESRWEKARQAYKVAIEAAISAGHELFNLTTSTTNGYPLNSTMRILRSNMSTPVETNLENIWTYAFDEGEAGLQRRSMPFIDTKCYNGVAPTLNMLRRFYTINGLPYDKDPTYNIRDEFETVKITSANNSITIGEEQEVIAKEGKYTSQMNLHREPRYYAWISFQGGYYELDHGTGYDTNEIDKPGSSLSGGTRLVTEFLKDGNCGRKNRNANYSRSGFLNKKGVSPDSKADKTNPAMKKYPFPLLRLADLYLAYSECAAECGILEDNGDDKGAKYYLNLVRERAGIPDVDTSWSLVGETLDKERMIEIIRQERQIELYLERQNFWDMRRWLKAYECFNGPYKGMNIDGETIEEFSQEADITLNERVFYEHNYLLPFPSYDINNNENCVQNPGY